MDRRSFFAAAGLSALAGCTTCRLPLPRQVAGSVSDAHAHFFNASDLPVGGFLRHVIAPVWFKDLPGIVLALGDLAGELAKRFSVTARAEIAQLGSGTLSGNDGPDADTFARTAARYQEQLIKARGYVPLAARTPDTNRADSHLQLALLLGAVRFRRAAASERATFRSGVEIDPAVYSDIVLENPSAGETGASADAVPALYRDWAGSAGPDLKTLIRWVFLMCRSRCAHVLQYVEVIQAPGVQVRDAANLLVDYDAWLSDRPLAGSAHSEQVRYWTRYADVTQAIEGAPRLHTFAGFCPLKDAEEGLAGALESSLDRMKAWVLADRDGEAGASHRIAGFKLYPPMGFRPDRNVDFFLPQGRAADGIRARWIRKGWDLAQLGKRIDDSLDRLFRFCAERDVPIITHAAMSNGAMAGADQKAAPLHWLDRAKIVAGYGLYPLRVSLGHFDMGGFNNLVLEAALRMNRNPSLRTNIFFDLSYDESILAGNPGGLLNDLARCCKNANDDGDYIMFGSDWIMLGQQRNAPHYLTTLYQAASTHPFWGDKVEKLFRSNFQRFLNRPS